MRVLDISKHQGAFDARKAYEADINKVILRHAYAASPDTLALSWASRIRATGMGIGGYGFATWHYKSLNGGSLSTARALMQKQVAKWITLAKQSGCNFWFAVDQELEAGQQMGLGKADNTALLNEACDLLAEAGLHPCVYCSVAWDCNYIKTAILRYPYWMARYVDGDADFTDAGAQLDKLPAGRYTTWMRKLFDAGRLVGWQFGSTGHGAQYGVGSANVDRSIFYLWPDDAVEDEQTDLQPEPDVQYALLGPMSAGDLDAVDELLVRLAIPYSTAAGDEGTSVCTTIPVSTGDQAQLIALADKLCLPIQLMDELTDEPKPAEGYSVVYLGFVVKGGFASAQDARMYIESVLGKDALHMLVEG